MGKNRAETEGEILIEDEVRTKEPPMYRVVLLNDNYTTMEFVVLVLQSVFHRTPSEAERIMRLVHETGSGTAGIYTKEVAETKVAVVHQLARQNEFPLRCALEPA